MKTMKYISLRVLAIAALALAFAMPAKAQLSDNGYANVDWQFNAWGGMVDGLYAHWEKDNAAARAICAALGMDCYDAQHFVLEGGSIHSDGEGTILATEACLLSRGRSAHRRSSGCPGASTTTRPTSMWTTCAPMWVRQRWCWRGRRTKTTRSTP